MTAEELLVRLRTKELGISRRGHRWFDLVSYGSSGDTVKVYTTDQENKIVRFLSKDDSSGIRSLPRKKQRNLIRICTINLYVTRLI